MLPQIARTCIIADYRALWSEIIQSRALLAIGHKELRYMASEARITCAPRWRDESVFPPFLRDIESIAVEQDVELVPENPYHNNEWKAFITRRDNVEPSSTSLFGSPLKSMMNVENFSGV